MKPNVRRTLPFKAKLYLAFILLVSVCGLLLPILSISAQLKQPARANQILRPSAALTASMTSALQTDNDGDGKVDPGDRVRYTATISNPNATAATGVNFTDTIDSNSTLVAGSVAFSPVPVDDSFAASGNIGITVSAAGGVLANDNLGSPAATMVTPTVTTSAQGGNVSLSADGSFTYNPPAGYEGTDTFNYSLVNSVGTRQGTVSITVTGMIWFVNNAAASCTTLASGCGRLSNPFSSLSAFQAINNGSGNNPATGDNIFIYSSGTNYTGPLTLLNSQKLIGQGASASLQAISGINPPAGSASLPTTGGTLPTIAFASAGQNNVTLASGNTLRGLNLSNTAGTALTGTNIGTLTASEASISATNSSSCGSAVSLTTGALNVSFTAVTVTGCTSGIILNGTSGTFSVTGVGSTADSGGIIQTTVGDNNAATSNGDGVFINNSTATVTLNRMKFSNVGDIGVNVQSSSGINITNSSFTNTGAGEASEHSINLRELTGTNNISGCAFNGIKENGVDLLNTTTASAATLTIDNSTFQNYLSTFGKNGVSMRKDNNASVTATVSNSTFTIDADGSDGTEAVTMRTGVVSGNFTGTIQNNVFNAGGGFGSGGISVSSDGTSISNFHITGNQVNQSNYNAIDAGSNGNSQMSAVITGNTVSGNPSFNSGNGSNGRGIYVLNDANLNTDSPKTNTLVSGNTIQSGFQFEGIYVFSRDARADTNALLTATVTNNTVAASQLSAGTSVRVQGTTISSDPSAGRTNTVCTRISGNSVTAPSGGNGLRLQLSLTSTVKEEAGVSGSTDPTVVLSANNPATSVNTATGTVNVVANGVCAAAPSLAPPIQENRADLTALQNADSLTNEVAADSKAALPTDSQSITEAAENTETPSGAARFVSNNTAFIQASYRPSAVGKIDEPNVVSSGETATANIGTLAASKTVTVIFDVTVNNPLPTPEITPINVPAVTQLTTQATVSTANFGNTTTSEVNTVVDNTTTTVSAGATSVFGENVTLTATAAGTGTPPPVGSTVRFYDGTNLLGTGTISVVGPNRQTTLATSSLTVGSHSIRAVYNGGNGSNGSISATFTPTVAKANTALTVTSSSNPQGVNRPLTLTATVSAVAPGGGIATGLVQFKDGGNPIGSPVALDALGQASLFYNTLTVGTHQITADYAGDANFNPSNNNGAPLNQVIDTTTAAGVNISGRVLSQDGRGISKALLVIIDADGEEHYALSNQFGYYHFANVPSGFTYTFNVSHKRFMFAPVIVSVNSELTELNFTAQP